MNRTIQLACAVALLGFTTACGWPYSKPIKTSARAEPEVGYIYGRFKQTYNDAAPSLTVGLILQSSSEDDALRIRLRAGQTLVFAVKPGTYTLKQTGIGESTYIGRLAELPAKDVRSFSIEPGKAHYIGDFTARTRAVRGYESWNISWWIHVGENSYEETTARMRKRFPALAGLETVDVSGSEASR
ncbi:MAG TPA: hypothetical protein VF794_00150 [Archangium sp.]|jgi:hypothetical protein|uniref:hypothetical protein n=1 Tax=Archangium sp. TaxID=1872627 RepID=UPI002ED8D0D5